MIDALTKSTFVKWYSQSTVYGYIHPSNSMYQTWNPENFSKRMGWIFNRKLPQIWEVKEIFYSLCLKRKNNLQHELVNRTSNTDPWRLTFKFRSYFLWKMLCHESNTSSSVQVSTSSFFSVNVRHILSFSTCPTRKTVKAWTRTSAKTQPSIFRRESPLTSLACADIRGLWSTLTKKVVDSGLIRAWYSHATRTHETTRNKPSNNDANNAERHAEHNAEYELEYFDYRWDKVCGIGIELQTGKSKAPYKYHWFFK